MGIFSLFPLLFGGGAGAAAMAGTATAAAAGGAFSSLATGAASALAGGAINSFFDRQASGRAITYQDPAAIRARYEAAGFNPLLAFKGNGAGTSYPALSGGTAADAIIAGAFDRDQQAEIARANLEVENQRLAMLNQRMVQSDPGTQAATSSSDAGGVGAGIASAFMAAPPARPTIGSAKRVPVFGPAGQQINVPASWAERMGIKPWGYLAAGEYSELVGEIVGEVGSTVFASEIGKASGADLGYQSPPQYPAVPQRRDQNGVGGSTGSMRW